jgi:hypothetical protein
MSDGLQVELPAWQFRDEAGRVVSCAWCERELGVTQRPAGISHGICARHFREQLALVTAARGETAVALEVAA